MKKACQNHHTDCNNAITANPSKASHGATLTKLGDAKAPKHAATKALSRDMPPVEYSNLLQQRAKHLIDVERPFWRKQEESYNNLRVSVGLKRADPAVPSSPPTVGKTPPPTSSSLDNSAHDLDLDSDDSDDSDSTKNTSTSQQPASRRQARTANKKPAAKVSLPYDIANDLDDLI